MMRRASVAMTALGSLLLFAGILVGLVNRNVLDGPRFAHHVDAVVSDPAVSRQIGRAITDQVLAARPDLVAVRPLIEAAASSLPGSPPLRPIVRASVLQLHRAFTDPDSRQVALQLANVGAVLAAVLPTIAPAASVALPADLQVTLAHVGDQSFAARTIRLTRIVGVLAWLLPVSALLCFACGLWLAADRRRASVRTGWFVTAAGIGVGAVAAAGAVWASLAEGDTLHSALVRAGWREFGSALWWAAALVTAAGGLLVLASAALIPQVDVGVLERRAWVALTRSPTTGHGRIGRGSGLVLLGVALVLRPAVALTVAGGLIGLLLLLAGVGELVGVANRDSAGPTARRRSVVPGKAPIAVLVVAVAVLVSLVSVDGIRADRQVPPLVNAAQTAACNGHVELCDRPYNDVAFPATHNAMSAADEPGWFLAEQPTGLIGQLDAGIRVLLIDTWYGQPSQRRGAVVTAPGSHVAALAKAEQLFGPGAVASALRVRDAAGLRATGPAQPYLCHGLCEIGATEWEPVMAQVHAWVVAHPREVVTFFIEDSVSPADTAAVFQRAGLLPYVRVQQVGQPWPTLGQMIDSGRRVVVLTERQSGGAAYPWLLPGFDLVQDTPYTNPSKASLSCARQRGTTSSPLLLLNYWLSAPGSRVSDAAAINAYDVLWPYATRCSRERGLLPNYLAVNFYDHGDLFRVVDQLNGFAPAPPVH
jgi:hypothetical protein